MVVTAAGVRVGIIVKCVSELLEIVQTAIPPSRLAGLLNRRQQQADKDADDGDHNEEFDEGERRTSGKCWW